ncbi:MAG: DUF1957 domain-containing protein [Treponema sp.]|jgi:1,4-alpha-glucan branching enzyme|nr:DUF1957 domain-containing protein [Treponema sp.]
MNSPRLSIIIVGHHPFVSPSAGEETTAEEQDFFETLSETWLPLAELFGELEREKLLFRFGIVLSPTLCAMWKNAALMEKYLRWLDRRVVFGERELRRCAGDEKLLPLAERYYRRDCRRRAVLSEQYGMDLLDVFGEFCRRGRLEPLLTAATNAFLPFYVSMDEAIRAQVETAIIHHRKYLGRVPSGFWLPGLGWSAELGAILQKYNFAYTVADAHGLVLARPPAEKGAFFPVKTPEGFTVFGRDVIAGRDMAELAAERAGVFQSRCLDAGFELPPRALGDVLGLERCRRATGYRYWTGDKGGRRPYSPQAAEEAAEKAAAAFVDRLNVRLGEARRYMEENPLSVWTVDADALGYSWHEGPVFLAALVREAARRGPRLCTPMEYLGEIPSPAPEKTEFGFSSALENGYGEMLLDASNDWIYRHLFRSIQRMAELTERFSGDSGLKERALNQAGRELLIAQSMDWSLPLNPRYQGRTSRDRAEQELEGALRNFTTIYEALGSNHISTEWLTALERRHSLLPAINHRVFGRKR